ncbi:MAG: glycosyltransferase [Propionibacteriaceae bacterium]|jgi:glycosyltransferase involved in cell wall biosynthesis|nr:glycosyltransferase [Propionibacteriaceae bacterium]
MAQNQPGSTRVCYLSSSDPDSTGAKTGVDKKISAQIEAFNKAGLPCEHRQLTTPETVWSRVITCLPFVGDGVGWPDPEEMAPYSCLYIRRPRFISKDLFRFIKAAKRLNPSLKVILEIPTYPYDGEMKTLLRYPSLVKDRANRAVAGRYIDRVTSLTSDKMIFGTKAIQILNGVDLNLISAKQPAPSVEEINIIMVAHFERWHGLDRLVAGVIKYYEGRPDRKVVLHIVGDGEGLPGLINQSKVANLDDRIIFHGYRTAAELSELYSLSSLGVESLGFHRVGLTVSSTLKSREYLARGIPFITGNDIDTFLVDPVDFCLKVPRDDSSIDIQSIIDFHDRLYSRESQEDLIARIRAYAESHIGMDRVMDGVVTYIKNPG